ncbi:MAG: GrpB family protein [bacterium]|nr:GrpB family protein [bacterium]
MLNQGEINFLSKIPSDKIVKILPYDPRVKETASEIIKSICQRYPDLKVIYLGASSLGISGQGDLDIYCLASTDTIPNYLDGLIELFGQPKSSRPDSFSWKFQKDGFDGELYLTDPDTESMGRQIKIYEELRRNPEILLEYEQLKQGLNGKSFKEYQEKKYEFYHRIIGD